MNQRVAVAGVLLLILIGSRSAGAQQRADAPMLVLDSGGHTGPAWQVAFTPDGRELVSVSGDKTVRVWDVFTGQPTSVLRPPIGPGPDGILNAVAVSPDGRTLAVAGYTPSAQRQSFGIYLISRATWRVERVLKGHTNVIIALAFSRDGQRLASGGEDTTVRVWKVATGENDFTLRGHTSHVYSVAFSPDGRRLASGSLDRTGRVWSLATGNTEAVLSGHAKEVFSIAWRPDGQVLATGGYDRSIRMWAPDGTPYRGFDLDVEVTSVAFTANSRELLFAGGGTNNVRGTGIIDIASGGQRVRFTGHENTVNCGSISPDGTLVATSDFLGEVHLWRSADAAFIARLASTGKAIWNAAWSRDGQSVLWGTRNTGGDPASRPLERSFRLTDLEFDPIPQRDVHFAQVARGSLRLQASGSKGVAVMQGVQTQAVFNLSGENDQVRCFTLLGDDRAAVGSDIGLTLFDTRTGRPLRHAQKLSGAIWALVPSPDNRLLVSASNDQTVRIWNPDQDEPLLSLFVTGDDWIAWAPGGYYAASPGGERLMGWHVGRGPDQLADFYPAAQFRKSLYRPDVIQRLLKTGNVTQALAEADRLRGRVTERIEVAQVLPPTVIITAPTPSGLKVPSAEIEVQAAARSAGQHPVTALRLLVDGRSYEGLNSVKKIDAPRLGEVRESWNVQLDPGRHRLRVLADSAVSQGDSEEVEVVYAGEDPAKSIELPSLYVLAIGISAYPSNLQLNYAAKDAQSIAQTFRDKSRPLFRKIEVKSVLDREATRAEILKGLGWLRRELTQKDYGVVFFAGHADRDADGALYLLPADVEPNDLLSTSVPTEQLKTTLAGLPGKIIFMLDACHAGAVDVPKRRAARGLTDDLIRDLVTDENGVIAMCSSTGREFSLENNEHRQGNFTQALVEGLSGRAGKSADGAVYLHHLDSYVTDRVKELTRGQQHPVTSRPASIRSFPLSKP